VRGWNDATGAGWQATGVVSRHVGYLRLALISGTLDTAAGTIPLVPTTIDLPVHPAQP